jgi:hypothetical protein
MPALEVSAQLLIEHAGSYLQQSMGAVWCPPHLLFLDGAFADYLVDGRLDQSGRNRLAVSICGANSPARFLEGRRCEHAKSRFSL